MRTLDDLEKIKDKKSLKERIKELPPSKKIAVTVVVVGGFYFGYKYLLKKR